MSQPLKIYKLLDKKKCLPNTLHFWYHCVALHCFDVPFFWTDANQNPPDQRKRDFTQALISRKMNICLSNMSPCWRYFNTPTTQTTFFVRHPKSILITHPTSKPPLFLDLCSSPSCRHYCLGVSLNPPNSPCNCLNFYGPVPVASSNTDVNRVCARTKQCV